MKGGVLTPKVFDFCYIFLNFWFMLILINIAESCIIPKYYRGEYLKFLQKLVPQTIHQIFLLKKHNFYTAKLRKMRFSHT